MHTIKRSATKRHLVNALQETSYLLQSAANAERLRQSIKQVEEHKCKLARHCEKRFSRRSNPSVDFTG